MKHFLYNVKIQTKRKKLLIVLGDLVFKYSKVWGAPGRVCERGLRGTSYSGLGLGMSGGSIKFTSTQFVVARCACVQKPARFPVEIFFLVLTQFLPKAGRICDKELFFVFTQTKSCCFSPYFPPWSW